MLPSNPCIRARQSKYHCVTFSSVRLLYPASHIYCLLCLFSHRKNTAKKDTAAKADVSEQKWIEWLHLTTQVASLSFLSFLFSFSFFSPSLCFILFCCVTHSVIVWLIMSLFFLFQKALCYKKGGKKERGQIVISYIQCS